jgi:hypothetical protein
LCPAWAAQHHPIRWAYYPVDDAVLDGIGSVGTVVLAERVLTTDAEANRSPLRV